MVILEHFVRARVIAALAAATRKRDTVPTDVLMAGLVMHVKQV